MANELKVDFLNLRRLNASFSPELEQAAQRVLTGGLYLHGRETEAFEQEWAAFVGTDYAVSCASGLDALYLVLAAWKHLYGWDLESEVVVPANTFIATVLAISRAGLRPVLCDVDERDGLATAETMSRVLTTHTVCLLPVHLYGQVGDMASLRDLAISRGLRLLEDACQAHGAKCLDLGKRAGSLGHAAAFSFYPGKNLGALGDAGCVTTDDEELAGLVRQLANYGQRVKYVHDFQGINSRMDEVQAAMLRVKLRRLDMDNEQRRRVAAAYLSAFKELRGSREFFHLPLAHGAEDNVWHIFPLRLQERSEFQDRLRSCGVQTLIHYPIPVHHQKAYAAFSSLSFPVAEKWCSEELSLPMSPLLTDAEIEYVIDTVRQTLLSMQGRSLRG